MHRFLTFTGAVLLTLLPCSCQTPSRTGALAPSGSLADALAAAEVTSTGNSAEELKANAAATERAALLWFAQSGPSRKPVTVQGAGRTWTLSAAWPENLLFDELLPPPPLTGDDESPLVNRTGAGAPLIAHWRYTAERKAKHPFLAEAGYLSMVTATLEFRGRNATLRLRDPRLEQTVTLAGRPQVLSADLTAWGRWVNIQMKQDKRLGISGIGAMRHSGEYMDKMGIFTLEPPSRERIPLVMIHGLMSRPLTWAKAYDELGSDPAIIRRYQFYFFRYPTGIPVIMSAGKCREDLARLKQELDRTGNTAYRGRIIVIGHSMGGLVTKTQVQNSGDRLWEAAFGGTPEAMGLPAEDVKALRPLMEFTPNPDISRVVFVCTPHRGSKLAEGFIGAIGSKLIKLPFQVLKLPATMLQEIPPSSPVAEQLKTRGIPSSIDNLSPESTFVKVSNQLPFKPGLHIHTIAGNKKGRALDDPKCSDGAVPYSSAHFDGVDSEIVVRSGHSAHETPEAIAEIRRILMLHAGR